MRNYFSFLGEKSYKAVHSLISHVDLDSRLHYAGIELSSGSVKTEIENVKNWKFDSAENRLLCEEIIDLYKEIMSELSNPKKPGSEGYIMNSIRAMEDWDKSTISNRIVELHSKVHIFNDRTRQS